MVEGEGFEPSKLTQQIYSLPPLAARESLRVQADNYGTTSIAVNGFLAEVNEEIFFALKHRATTGVATKWRTSVHNFQAFLDNAIQPATSHNN